jgi:hypothetical protein
MEWFNLMEDVLIPICVCCVLPISIVLIVFIYRNRALAQKTEVIKLAIEKGAKIDPDTLMDALSGRNSKSKTVMSRLLNRLTWGILLLLTGIVSGIVLLCQGPDAMPDSKYVVVSIVSLSVGVALLVSYFVGRKMLGKEVAAEEDKQTDNE